MSPPLRWGRSGGDEERNMSRGGSRIGSEGRGEAEEDVLEAGWKGDEKQKMW